MRLENKKTAKEMLEILQKNTRSTKDLDKNESLFVIFGNDFLTGIFFLSCFDCFVTAIRCFALSFQTLYCCTLCLI